MLVLSSEVVRGDSISPQHDRGALPAYQLSRLDRSARHDPLAFVTNTFYHEVSAQFSVNFPMILLTPLAAVTHLEFTKLKVILLLPLVNKTAREKCVLSVLNTRYLPTPRAFTRGLLAAEHAAIASCLGAHIVTPAIC